MSRRVAAKVDMSVPTVAWATVLLFIGCMVVWSIALALPDDRLLISIFSFCLATAAAFAIFTPLHESTHRSLSRLRWVNELLGRLSAIMLVVTFPMFRYLHLEHHRHTNDREKDPDLWSGRGPAILLPVRWLTQDIHYLWFYLKRIKRRPRAEQYEFFLTIILYLGIVLFFAGQGQLSQVFFYWLLPARLAVVLLAFAFDYLPHTPHQIAAADNPCQATSVMPVALLTPLFLYQNYHLIHHLYPGLPFYRYARAWREQRAALIARGAIVRDIFGREIK
jgi:beta-carotene hydroxylase